MDREPELKIIRRAFAKQVIAACGIRNPRVEAAFAAVAREDFLGPGPLADCALGRRLSCDAGILTRFTCTPMT
jgi:protein-L-isoaspartate O-methyltransferase